MAVALEQALLNALYHGNLELDAQQLVEAREQSITGKRQTLVEQRKSAEPYCRRRILVDIRISRERAPDLTSSRCPDLTTLRYSNDREVKGWC